MRADTKTISIEASPADVFRYVADPAHLPRWAVGFAKDVRQDGDRWLVTTTSGVIPVRVRADPATRVVDFLLEPAPGVEVAASSRVLARGDGAEYVLRRRGRARGALASVPETPYHRSWSSVAATVAP